MPQPKAIRASPKNVAFFPWARRIVMVREVAVALDTRANDGDRKAYWSQTVRSIRAALARLGADDVEIGLQIEQFGLAVTAELCRRAS